MPNTRIPNCAKRTKQWPISTVQRLLHLLVPREPGCGHIDPMHLTDVCLFFTDFSEKRVRLVVRAKLTRTCHSKNLGTVFRRKPTWRSTVETMLPPRGCGGVLALSPHWLCRRRRNRAVLADHLLPTFAAKTTKRALHILPVSSWHVFSFFHLAAANATRHLLQQRQDLQRHLVGERTPVWCRWPIEHHGKSPSNAAQIHINEELCMRPSKREQRSKLPESVKQA